MAALAGMVGPVLFTTLVVAQGELIPEYSHVRMPISALAAWPTGWIQELNFYVFGVLSIVFALGLHQGVRPASRGAMGVPLLLMSGIGIGASGVFSWKMVGGVPKETLPHVVAAVAVFGGVGLGLMVFSRRLRADPQWRDLSGYAMVSGLTVLVLFLVAGRFAIGDGTPLHPWAGLLQRVLCAVWLACIIVLAIRLRTLAAANARTFLRPPS
jgi:hypothetical membrane protein